MTVFGELLSNRPLVCALLSWFVAQILKVLINLAMERKLDFKRLIGMGGMPSSHSAFVFSLCLMVGLHDGFQTTAFAISFALMAVVIYDAMGVRAETGKQGAAINMIFRELLVEGKPLTNDNLKELVGHTPLEVIGGIIVGAVMVIIMAC